MPLVASLLCVSLWLGPAETPPSALDQALADTVCDGLILQSDVDWHRGDYARAARALLVSTEFDPGNEGSWLGAAWLLWSWSAKQSALTVLDRMVATLPGSADALWQAGQLARMQGDSERAIRWLREAHRIDPADANASIELGAVLRKRELWDEAAEVYRDLERAHPGHPSARRFLDRYEKTGQMKPESGPPVESAPSEPPPRPRVAPGRVS